MASLTKSLNHKTKKFKSRTKRIVGAGGIVFVLIFAALVAHHLFSTHAANSPLTAAISVCGARSSSDVEGPRPTFTSYPITYNNQTNNYVNKNILAMSYVTQQTGILRYWPGTGSQDARWYVMTGGNSTQVTFHIYDAKTNALITQFSSNLSDTSDIIAQSFAVDPSGNIYIGQQSTPTGTISSIAVGGAVNWSVHTTNLLTGAVYGYTNSSGNFLVGAVVGGAAGTGENNAEVLSNTFNTSGVSEGNTSVVGDVITESAEHNNDIVSVQFTKAANYASSVIVYSNNSSGINQTLSISTPLAPGAAGPFHFYQVNGANEEADGTLVVSDPAYGLEFFQPNGVYLGRIAQGLGGGITGVWPTIESASGFDMEEFGGNIYMLTGDNGGALMQLNEATAQTYINTGGADSAQGSPFHLGIGAGPFTTAQFNYFTSGSQAQSGVLLQFYQNPWENIASSGLTGSYTIRTVEQIKAGIAGTSYPFTVPSNASAYSSGYYNVPLTLPSTAPGYYEMNVSIQQAGKTIGADCLDYTIGTSNAAFNPTNQTNLADANLSNPSSDVSGVAFAYLMGQKDYRSLENIDACYPTLGQSVVPTTGNLTPQCPPGWAQAAKLASELGINFEVQIGAGDPNFMGTQSSNGGPGPGATQGTPAAIQIFQTLVKNMVASETNSTDPSMSVKNWECWNEPNTQPFFNDNWTIDGVTNYVDDALIPCFNGVNAGSNNTANVIGGGFSDMTPNDQTWTDFINDNGLKYIDTLALHAYTGQNRSWEEQNFVVPPLYATTADPTGTVQQFQQEFSDAGYNGPIWDTESGYWVTGPVNSYAQGDMLVRKQILERSVGITNLANFQNDVGYNVGGLADTLVYNGSLTTGAAASIVYNTELNGRSLIKWLSTGIPHVYAAEFGPSSSDTGDIVAVWTDDFNTNVVPSLQPGNGTINVVDEYGQASTVASGSNLAISGTVEYLSVPSGQTISLSSPETFGPNLSNVSSGATVSSSSSYDCNPNDGSSGNGSQKNGGFDYADPNVVISGPGNANNYGSFCGGVPLWAPQPDDPNPSLTITLAKASAVDRVYVSSQGLGSNETGLRNYTMSFYSGTDGSGNLIASYNETNSFFNRDNMIQLPSTLNGVSSIEFTNMTAYISGYSDGLDPLYWYAGTPEPLPFYDVEAYGPGSGSQQTPPSAPTNLSATPTSPTSVSLNWTAATAGSSPIAGYYILRNGSIIQTQAGTTTSYTDNTALPATTYSYTVEAYDTNQLASSPSNVAPATTPPAQSQPPVSPTSISAVANSATLVTVTWPASTSSNVSGYYVLRASVVAGVTGPYTTLNPSGTTNLSYPDSTVNPNSTYSYEVEAYNTSGTSTNPPSTQVSTPTQQAPPPTAPTKLRAEVSSSAQINLRWTASTSEIGIAGYNIFRNSGGSSAINTSKPINPSLDTSTSYGDTSLKPSTRYSYYVVAVDTSKQNSAASRVVHARTLSTSTTTGIQGKVTNTDKKALSGVTIYTEKTHTSTNSSGTYYLVGLNTGEHYFYYVLNGYNNASPVLNIKNNVILTNNLTLKKI